MFKIEHSLLTSPIATFCRGWGSHVYHRSIDLKKNTIHRNSRSICKQTATIFTSEKLMDLVVNLFLNSWMGIIESHNIL